MAYVYEQQMPPGVTDEMYAFIVDGLGPEPPPGLVCHLALRTPEGLRYVEVWRSREECQRFVDERLHPVVARMFQRFHSAPPGEGRPAALAEGGGGPPRWPEPARSEPKVVDVWAPGYRSRAV